MQLEFQFGALAHRMSQKGDPVGLNDAVMALVDGMDGLVQRLPAPAEGVLEQMPLASDALPVAVEVTAPKSELTTYGDAKN